MYTTLSHKFGDFEMSAIIAISATILIMAVMLIGAMIVYKMSVGNGDGE